MLTQNLENISDRILNLYRQYIAENKNANLKQVLGNDLSQIERDPLILQNLTIELPIDQIEQVFREHKVIQLRPLGIHHALLLGCGNRPADPNYREGHDHQGFETINPELSMNPNLVGAFGYDEGVLAILPDKHYHSLWGEAVTIGTCASDFDKRFLGCMRPDFGIYEIGEKEQYKLENSFLFWYPDVFSSLCALFCEKFQPDAIKMEDGKLSICFNNETRYQQFFSHYGGKEIFDQNCWKLQLDKEKSLSIFIDCLKCPSEEYNHMIEKLFEEADPSEKKRIKPK